MNQQETKRFIKDLLYNLETVRILMNSNRLKETLPIVYTILNNFRAFDKEFKTTSQSLIKILNEDWLEVSIKIEKFVNNNIAVSDQELKSIQYDLFLENLTLTIANEIKKLKQNLKSPLQKKIEVFLPILSIILLITVVYIKNTMTKDWGLQGYYYLGTNFEEYVASGTNKNINFDEISKTFSLLPKEMVSIRWLGQLLIPEDDVYTFSVIVDDGVRLFIDEQCIIDQWTKHSISGSSKSVPLKKGSHKIKIEYFNIDTESKMKIFWKSQGIAKQILSKQYLRLENSNNK